MAKYDFLEDAFLIAYSEGDVCIYCNEGFSQYYYSYLHVGIGTIFEDLHLDLAQWQRILLIHDNITDIPG